MRLGTQMRRAEGPKKPVIACRINAAGPRNRLRDNATGGQQELQDGFIGNPGIACRSNAIGPRNRLRCIATGRQPGLQDRFIVSP